MLVLEVVQLATCLLSRLKACLLSEQLIFSHLLFEAGVTGTNIFAGRTAKSPLIACTRGPKIPLIKRIEVPFAEHSSDTGTFPEPSVGQGAS